MFLYLENVYIIVWALLALGWIYLSIKVYNKSKEENQLRNTAITVISGILVIFLATAVNPVRRDLSVQTTPNMFVAPVREAPERIVREPQLTDERRAESLRELREASRQREEYEFGTIIIGDNIIVTTEEDEDEEAENKGD